MREKMDVSFIPQLFKKQWIFCLKDLSLKNERFVG